MPLSRGLCQFFEIQGRAVCPQATDNAPIQVDHVLQGSLGQDSLAPPAGATVQEPPLPRHSYYIEDSPLEIVFIKPVNGVNLCMIRFFSKNIAKQFPALFMIITNR